MVSRDGMLKDNSILATVYIAWFGPAKIPHLRDMYPAQGPFHNNEISNANLWFELRTAPTKSTENDFPSLYMLMILENLLWIQKRYPKSRAWGFMLMCRLPPFSLILSAVAILNSIPAREWYPSSASFCFQSLSETGTFSALTGRRNREERMITALICCARVRSSPNVRTLPPWELWYQYTIYQVVESETCAKKLWGVPSSKTRLSMSLRTASVSLLIRRWHAIKGHHIIKSCCKYPVPVLFINTG